MPVVGEAAAQIVARDEFCRQLMLIDVQGELAQSKALDVWQTAVESGADTRVYGGSKAKMLEGWHHGCALVHPKLKFHPG